MTGSNSQGSITAHGSWKKNNLRFFASLRMTANVVACHVERSETSLAIVFTVAGEMIRDSSLHAD
jgi:hypothetical protein